MPYIREEVPGQTQEQHLSQGKNDQGNPVAPGTHSTPVSMPVQLDSPMPVCTQLPNTITLVKQGTTLEKPPKMPSIGKNKPLNVIRTPSSLASKKQKVSGDFQDQSIDQLNDVTAVSGINLREEEELLFSWPKEESRASEATRRVVQEEKEMLMMQKSPLQEKLAAIMLGCGIKNASKGVECCLSPCLEKRMQGLICNSIRVSKQDDGNTGADGEMDKDKGCTKTLKENQEEDDKKKRITAANVAA
ncbi:Transcription initiation factor tfiid subunit 4b [Thalictrum thalictroides]|uniref:Transcription initiation factor tfiid subunit 4b n=1 Tax=Thalictrum thalictroides TaxID=46969 RepID=A0A7J6V7N6_THATH|nr:Transcription initiation factor tfiid subunit 4b [Thalictrum thalictroides]